MSEKTLVRPWLTLTAPVQHRGKEAWNLAVQEAVKQIKATGFGHMSLQTVESATGVPYRTLQRWFQNKVGLGVVAAAVMQGTGQMDADQAWAVHCFLVGTPKSDPDHKPLVPTDVTD